jgi:hypothetical protein
MSQENQKFLSHYGVPGMRWGARRANSTLDSTANSFKRSAKKLRDKANWSSTYSLLRTKANGEVGGGLSRKLDVSNANARSERLNEKAVRNENVAKGIEKAKKLVSGMDMKQSIKTLQDASGYSKGQKIMAKFMSQKEQLSFASIDYALKKTNGGRKS